MLNPRCSKSSPVLATTSSSSAGKTRLRPSASLGPPTPPAHYRLAFGTLPHHERRCSGDLVRMPGDADLKLAAEQIGRSAQIHQRREAGGTNRDAAGTAPPGTAAAVANDHRDWHAEP